MAIVLVAHTKGGVSKTTTTANLGVMRAAAGRRVLMVDMDSGQSLQGFHNARKLANLKPTVEVVTLFSEQDEKGQWKPIHKAILRLAEEYDDILIDAGGEGHGAPEIRMALAVAHKVVTPCRPTKADTARLDKMAKMIEDARALNDELDAMLYPTQASTHARATDVIRFYRDAAKFPQYRILESVMRGRSSYQEWASTGEAIFEQKKLDKQAMDEMSSLYKEVFND